MDKPAEAEVKARFLEQPYITTKAITATFNCADCDAKLDMVAGKHVVKCDCGSSWTTTLLVHVEVERTPEDAE